jgi:nitroreductase
VEVLDAIRRRRMHRRFDERPVPDVLLLQVAEAAARAPMAANLAIRRIVIVTDRRVLKTLRQLTPGLSVDPPALLALCSDLELAVAETGRHGRDISSYIDAGAAAENAALAAAALGLGASFARSCTESAIGVALGLPVHVRPDILVSVGYVAASPSRAPRRPAIPIFYDEYGSERSDRVGES